MSTSTAIGSRHRTGETCLISGVYRFDGYLDGTSSPSPTADEREIPLSKEGAFPPIRSTGKACWWKLVRKA